MEIKTYNIETHDKATNRSTSISNKLKINANDYNYSAPGTRNLQFIGSMYSINTLLREDIFKTCSQHKSTQLHWALMGHAQSLVRQRHDLQYFVSYRIVLIGHRHCSKLGA